MTDNNISDSPVIGADGGGGAAAADGGGAAADGGGGGRPFIAMGASILYAIEVEGTELLDDIDRDRGTGVLEELQGGGAPPPPGAMPGADGGSGTGPPQLIDDIMAMGMQSGTIIGGGHGTGIGEGGLTGSSCFITFDQTKP